LQTGGVIALTLDSSQNATFAGTVAVNGSSITTGLTSGTSNGTLDFKCSNSGGGNRQWRISSTATSGDSNQYGLTIRDVTGAIDALKIAYDTGNTTFAGTIAIGNTVNTVSPTSPNRTITMVIGGTTYYIHAKTTND
jgi:hypothetical protein